MTTSPTATLAGLRGGWRLVAADPARPGRTVTVSVDVMTRRVIGVPEMGHVTLRAHDPLVVGNPVKLHVRQNGRARTWRLGPLLELSAWGGAQGSAQDSGHMTRIPDTRLLAVRG